MIDKMGLYPNITAREYHAEICPEPAFTSTIAKLLINGTPADAAYCHPAITPDHLVKGASPEMEFGDVAHQLALGKGSGFIISPYDDFRTKDAQLWKKSQPDGVTIIKPDVFAKAEAAADIMRTAIESRLLAIARARGFTTKIEYATEVVAACQIQTPSGPIWARIMMDVWCEQLGVIMDPKFSKVIRDGALEAHMTKMGWDIQGALYPLVMGIVRPDLEGRISFVNLVVHPEPPHLSRAVQMDEGWRYSSEMEVARAARTWGECLKTGVFPGYSYGIETVSARPWTVKERMEREMGDEEDE